MRLAYSAMFIALIAALAGCSFASYRSRRKIGRAVSLLTCLIIPPLAGNLIRINSEDKLLSMIGCYIFFIGMDLVVFSLLKFTLEYCDMTFKNKKLKLLVYSVLLFDAVQLLLNPVFGHAFDNEAIEYDGAPYYQIVPFWGQTFHRIVDYCIFGIVIVILIYKIVHSPRIYSERYSVILITLFLSGLWQGFYILSRNPVDRSMIGFAVIGLLIFYFSHYYRPLRLLDRMLSNIASDLPEALFAFDTGGKCIWINRPGLELTGLTETEFDKAPEKLIEMFGVSEIHSTETWSKQRMLGAGDDTRYYTVERSPVTDDRKLLAGSFIIVHDNTEEQMRIKREMYNATHDTLTDLYTREYLYECIQSKRRSEPDTPYYVVFVDVKNFKIVNDVFSSAFGDFALCCIADYLRSRLSANSVFGRLAGDTFGVFIPVAEFNAENIERSLSVFVVNDGTFEHHILIHLGVYEVTEAHSDVSVMFDRAHLALSTITDEYKTHIAYYDNKIREKVLWDQNISASLREALEQRQVRPYLQPITDREGRVVGAEALARWIHPEHGFLPPSSFIPVFEKNGMIVEVDRYMWRCACELLAKWESTRPELFISVNISPKDFYFIDVSAELRSLAAEYGISPSQLRIEITETVMMNDSEERMKILSDLRNAGFIVEMDDFGSGYSSLNLLKEMPVDVLKIDMKFLSKATDDAKAHTIIKNIIKLSRDLGISSLSEGVETESQYRGLAGIGCNMFQGYYFAKPMPAEEFEKYADRDLAENKTPS